MILNKRKTHLFSFTALIVILPIIFLVGVIFTPKYPAINNSTIQPLLKSNVIDSSHQYSTMPIADNDKILAKIISYSKK